MNATTLATVVRAAIRCTDDSAQLSLEHAVANEIQVADPAVQMGDAIRIAVLIGIMANESPYARIDMKRWSDDILDNGGRCTEERYGLCVMCDCIR